MNLEDNKTGHPFKTPDNYFEEMESRILSEVNLRGIEAPFKVKEDFFSKMEKEILARTTEEAKPLTVTYKKSSFRGIYRMAAGFLMFFGLGLGYYYYSSDNVKIDDLSNDEMVAYLEYQSISSSEIAGFLQPDAFDNKDILPEDLEIHESDIFLESDAKIVKSI
jgi:hypothetical protein